MHAVFNVRSEPTAEDWLAAIFARNKLGMAMAAIIRMMATTIKSSINEKPFCLRMGHTSALYVHLGIHRRGERVACSSQFAELSSFQSIRTTLWPRAVKDSGRHDKLHHLETA